MQASFPSTREARLGKHVQPGAGGEVGDIYGCLCHSPWVSYSRGLGFPVCAMSLLDRAFWHLSSALLGTFQLYGYKWLILRLLALCF